MDIANEVVVEGDLGSVDERVRALLKEEGFGVLTEIDVAATLEKKLGVDHPPHLILGACNPTLANEAMGLVPHVDALLPCNVTLTAEDGAVRVRIIKPSGLVHVLGEDAAKLEKIMLDADARLGRVAKALSQ